LDTTTQGVLVGVPGAPGLLWHPLPLPPGVDGAAPDPAEWAARMVAALPPERRAGARWATAPRPSRSWTLPGPTWGESVPGAGDLSASTGDDPPPPPAPATPTTAGATPSA